MTKKPPPSCALAWAGGGFCEPLKCKDFVKVESRHFSSSGQNSQAASSTKALHSSGEIRCDIPRPNLGDPMRKYGGLFLISSLLLASCNSPVAVQPEPKPMMQLAAGTFSGQANEKPGTSLLVKLMMPDGSAVLQDAQVTITGPKGWNEDKSRMITVYAGNYVNWLLAGAATPINGVYQASVNIAGQTYTATSGQINVTSVLGTAEPITAKDDGTRIAVTWPPVNGAPLYLQRVRTPDPSAPGEEILVDEASFYTRNASITFPSSVLTSGTSYDIAVLAFNTEVDKEKALNVPAQFNASRAFIAQPFFRNP